MNYISLGFGAITCFSGIAGVVLGAYAAGRIRYRASNSEPLISATGLLVSAQAIYLILIFVRRAFLAIWPLVLIGETALFVNWALVPKILIDCVVPQRRALASGSSTFIFLFRFFNFRK